ncbi:MAG: hypothetical protein AAB368_04620, partial [bacterium]
MSCAFTVAGAQMHPRESVEDVRPRRRPHGPAGRAARLTLCLGPGTWRGRDGRRLRKPLNRVEVIGPDGVTLGTHDKLLPTGGDLRWSARGDPRRLRVFSSGGLTFGVTICNDFWATPLYTTLPDL